jgi:hypothetical protein
MRSGSPRHISRRRSNIAVSTDASLAERVPASA